MSIAAFENVSVQFPTKLGVVTAVRNVSLSLPKGKITAIVGESGSGKSTLASTLLNHVISPGKIAKGRIQVAGKDVLKLTKQELRTYRWSEVAMVFQAAQNALNPVVKIEDQFIETYKEHRPRTEKDVIKKKTIELLQYVNLDPERVMGAYPHELSGGMKQRVMIAFSLLLDPKVLVLDEPTTALDVITQDYIFSILERINKDMGITMLLLSHDISIVARAADYMGVMYAGEIVEFGEIYSMFDRPKHPYTKMLIKAVPSLIHDLNEIKPIPGTSPNLLKRPSGCAFHPRCPFAMDSCTSQVPEFRSVHGQQVACHLYDQELNHEVVGG
ncbi:ABC transporter ATP-binding protein [Shouchella miscanthi]|uniref:ABC transporter ATP-binding protein n=1 Tax=Shouchella miscanthi TaxID=2598861 RepID=A0ABU6NPG9_9BACI|nr:ABC transporter ATP-binding protein [Shouchella miscanthi]